MLNVAGRRIKEIELLDAMCGTGKSYNLFKFISANPHECYLYVTPMLSEVSNRPAEVLAKFGESGVVFEEPTGEKYRTKGDHLLALLETRRNAICTHALFQGVGKAGQQSISKYGYTIIIDEELGMIEPLDDNILRRADRKLLMKEAVITTEEDGKVVWHNSTWGDDDSAFAVARKMADDGSLYSTKEGTFFNVQVPVELISAAKRVIVATYLFQGSIFQAFLKVKGIGCRPFAFEGMQLRDEKMLKKALQERIDLTYCKNSTDKLLRELGEPVDDIRAKQRSGAFSTSWYSNISAPNLVRIGHHIRNVARQMETSADDLIYTMPSTVAGKRGGKWVKNGARVIKVKSFSPENCFLHKGARETNNYSYKTSAIHAYNRYPHPAVTKYLQEHGGIVDHDSFALAEMIQWFFRTAIRIPNGPKVKFHIVSPRMELLFVKWLYD